MRNLLLSVSVLFLLSSFYVHGQTIPSCEDPNPYTIVTDCGTEIDLCIDRYTMNSDEREKELKIYNNDMGVIDPSLCYICDDVLHAHGELNGELTQLPNYNFMYSPYPDFVGMDTFYYVLVVYDTCMVEDYCESGDGKIWAIQSVYTGPDNATIEVFSKNANNWDPFDQVGPIDNGEHFWIDGSDLPTSQANWQYKIYLPGQTDPEVVDVHTSCSQDVLGKDFGYFRTITGCIATQQDKMNCNISDKVRNEINTRSSYMITTRFEDETMVVIEVLNVLAIDFSDFSVSTNANENNVNWNVNNVSNDDFIELEKSYNGITFFTVKTYNETITGSYQYVDPFEKGIVKYYYRLAIVDLNGNKRYSEIISISNESYDELISIYPNPIVSTIQMEVFDPKVNITQYDIWNATGELISRTFTEKSKHLIISTENLIDFSGLYLLNVTLDNGMTISKKILIVDMLN